jgi:hypothetical protein
MAQKKARKAAVRLPKGARIQLINLKTRGKPLSAKKLEEILKKAAKSKHIYLARNAPFKLRSTAPVS